MGHQDVVISESSVVENSVFCVVKKRVSVCQNSVYSIISMIFSISFRLGAKEVSAGNPNAMKQHIS